MKFPYSNENRLADVIALIQVLSLHENSHRSLKGLTSELQGKPNSAESWDEIAKEHPEFFRLKKEGVNKISLVARHVMLNNSKSKREQLPSDFVGKLFDAAIQLHDRELERKYFWRAYVPIIVAITAGVFTLIGNWLAR